MHTHNNMNGENPFNTMIDQLFNRSISDIVGADYTKESPSINIVEGAQEFHIDVAAPGLIKSDFKVTIEKDFLRVAVDIKEEKTEEDQGEQKRKEFNFNNFSRKFRLPKIVDKSLIEAKYELGVLRITLAKTEEAKEKEARTITID